MHINLSNRYYCYRLFVDEQGRLTHGGFYPADMVKEGNLPLCRQRGSEITLDINDEGQTLPRGNRCRSTPVTERLRYVRHTEAPTEKGVDHRIFLKDESTGMTVVLHYGVYENSPGLTRYTEVINEGKEELVLHHVDSFTLTGFPYAEGNPFNMYLHQFRSGWCYEGEHTRDSFASLGVYDGGLTGFRTAAPSSWVCQERIPCFVVEQPALGLYTAVQIEHSFAWQLEMGPEAYEGHYYIQGGMGDASTAGWHKELAPNESMVTPQVSMTAARGELDDALNLLQLHRERILIRRSPADADLPVIYNDWMCLGGDVTEENILPQLDTLKEMGIDVYVMDAGWFTEPKGRGKRSDWSFMVGCWDCNKERFPHGLSYLTETAHKKGIRIGIWCEIEAVGAYSPVYNDRDMLLTFDGKFLCNNNRRFLDFRSEKTRVYADSVFEKLHAWGFDYVKIDYNGDPGREADGGPSRFPAENMAHHRRCYSAWLRDLRARHPDMIIESCSSGGMRLEYDSLSAADLSSLTDNGNYRYLSRIIYNVSRVIHPSQSGLWTPTDNIHDGLPAVTYALCSSMMGRMHLSGRFRDASPELKKLLKESAAYYKRIRSILASCTVFHRSGDIFFADTENKPCVLEYRSADDNNVLLSLKTTEFTKEPLSCILQLDHLKNGIYRTDSFPKEDEREYTVTDGTLAMPYTLTPEVPGKLVCLRLIHNIIVQKDEPK